MFRALEAPQTDFEDRALDFGWNTLSPQVARFPSTRFMGSKEQLLLPLWRAIGPFSPQSVLDLCSGSGVVSYMLKAQGCHVIANDYMCMATTIAEATIANSSERLSDMEIEAVADATDPSDDFVLRTYGEIYFKKSDSEFLDSARVAVARLSDRKKYIARAALIRACIKRRPRGIFTYTGHRYDDGRKDLRLSLREHFVHAAIQINGAVFDNGRPCSVMSVDMSHGLPEVEVDVVYLDPPYFSPLSDNEYVRRYHFTEALARDWDGLDIQHDTKTKKIRNYPSPFRSEIGCVKALGEVLDRYRKSAIVISYSSNSLPTTDAIMALMRHHGRKPRLTEVDHRYSFGNQTSARAPVKNKVRELIFVAE